MDNCRRQWKPGQTELAAGVRGLTLDDVTDDTKIIMSQLHRREGSSQTEEQPVVQPIVHSTTYRIKSVDHYRTVSNEVSRRQSEQYKMLTAYLILGLLLVLE